jgi:hypothetical protein
MTKMQAAGNMMVSFPIDEGRIFVRAKLIYTSSGKVMMNQHGREPLEVIKQDDPMTVVK